ncbi:hypothetical protein [Methanocella arvoryzae]|uniref:Uncharacterized protein n=1 Tax=Methanocella arvoryzae (strain DSM 22066 / NBRC 105507 / MRE50) TaxID=351160 RepID=Q0W041_METAR|nr:hypothetical protein [Methanocella arvoryzae]CAJ38252.1 conserved hypothetical protein [Methanocella arvoryzae MRE50]
MERIHYHFPAEIDFERNYGYSADLRYLIKAVAGIHGKTGSSEFETPGPDIGAHQNMVRAKREVAVEISEKRMDFLPLTPQNLAAVLPTVQHHGMVDFRFTVKYSYFDKNFNKGVLQNDVFLVRATVDGNLNLQVAAVDGQGRTLPEEIANTIETQLKRFKG